MRPLTFTLIVLLPAVLGMPLAIPAAADDTALSAYAGSFKGKGTLRRKPDEPKETVRCRITAKLSADGLTLKQTGTCVVPGSKVAIDSKLIYNPANGRVTGRWTDVANGSAASVSGRANASGAQLTIAGTDTQTGESRTLWMTLKPASKGYLLITRSPKPGSGGKFVSGEIRFTK